jgi:hypothetical protein
MKCTSLQALAVMLAVAAPVAAEESSPQSSRFSTEAVQRVVRDASAGAASRKVMLNLAPFTALAGLGIGLAIDGMM